MLPKDIVCTTIATVSELTMKSVSSSMLYPIFRDSSVEVLFNNTPQIVLLHEWDPRFAKSKPLPSRPC